MPAPAALMGLRLACDGCDCALDQTAAVERGRLAKTFYCADCTNALDAAFAEIEAKRAQMVVAFETFRRERLATLRESVKVLPDA